MAVGILCGTCAPPPPFAADVPFSHAVIVNVVIHGMAAVARRTRGAFHGVGRIGLGRPDLGLVILGDDLLLRRTDQIAFGVRRGAEAQKEQKAAKAAKAPTVSLCARLACKFLHQELV
jgi:hypothetical protein